MRRSLGKFSSAALEKLLPSARGYACTPAYCQQSGRNYRCCQRCSGGVISCGAYRPGTCTYETCRP